MWYELLIEVAAENRVEAIEKAETKAKYMINLDLYKPGMVTDIKRSEYGFIVSIRVDVKEG